MSSTPRITFGVIVLNGEPFTRYCLRALYPFAYEIIVVEGASKHATSIATSDGHSIDGTLEVLQRFKADEDPENKVQIVFKEGFWSEKDEQSQAYAERATGDYLWQVDIDEFYQPEDLRRILDMLSVRADVMAVSFKQITFWGGFDYVADSLYLRQGAEIYHRLFRWAPGFRYATHRPPTVHNSLGRDLRTLKWINGYELADKGIFLYHYSLVFPKQVLDKCAYYDQATWVERKQYRIWAQNNFFGLKNPFRVHNVYDSPSWLERFYGRHPPAIETMRRDIVTGQVKVEMRSIADVEALLQSRRYQCGRTFLKCHVYIFRIRAIVSRYAAVPASFLMSCIHLIRSYVSKV